MIVSLAFAAAIAAPVIVSNLETRSLDTREVACRVRQVSPVTFSFGCTGKTLEKAIVIFFITNRDFVRVIGKRPVWTPSLSGGSLGYHVMFGTDFQWRNQLWPIPSHVTVSAFRLPVRP